MMKGTRNIATKNHLWHIHLVLFVLHQWQRLPVIPFCFELF